jgi:small multidrug resistance family-3 protein
MIVAKTIAIYVVAMLGELAGTYSFWRWRREHGPAWLIAAGLAALFIYAFIQTLQPSTQYGRLFAAYAAVFLVGAIVWGMVFDNFKPDRYDIIGAAIALVGAVVILWGRQIFR